MKFLIIKVKDNDLYFNADEMEGPYICDTPMLMDKEQINRAPHFEELLTTEEAYLKVAQVGARIAVYIKSLG